jgi:hypothetical protein
LNLFGSVRPERREGQRSKGRLVSSSRRRRRLVASSRFVVSSRRRLVVSLSFRLAVSFSFRLVVSFSFRLVVSLSFRLVVSLSFRLVVSLSFRRKGGRRREERGRRDELNQRGSKRPLEDALKSNFGGLLSTPPLKFSLVLPFLSTLLLGFFGSLPSLYGFFCRLAG